MTPFLLFLAILLLIVVVALRLSPPGESVSRETLLSRTFSQILEGRREDVLGDMRALYQKTGQDVGIGMALGVLFRHLGKNQIAIRTHRSLATRRELEPDFLALIHVELAADYLVTGSFTSLGGGASIDAKVYARQTRTTHDFYATASTADDVIMAINNLAWDIGEKIFGLCRRKLR